MAPELHEFWFRLKTLFFKRRLDADLAEELSFHQTMMQEKMQREGADARQAASATRAQFGNAARWQERLRELWQFRGLENLLRDLSFSARLLQRSPGFTCVALLTLALGIGATTSVFSLINGLLLRPLPVPQSDQLALLGIQRSEFPDPDFAFPAPLLRAVEKRHDAFTQVAGFFATTLQVRNGSGNEEVRGTLVSGQFFAMMRVDPLLGRYLTAEDDREGGPAEGFGVVLSESFWRNWFHADPHVLGRQIVIANHAFTVVGVMPKAFTGANPTQRPEIYLPLWAEPIVDAPFNNIANGVHAWWIDVIARRRPDVSLEQANASLAASSRAIVLEASGDDEWRKEAEKSRYRLVAMHGSQGYSYLQRVFRKPLLAVFALCGAMLLLACLNLTSLLMARANSRERELATRLAIGASRRRLVQQLLTESLLLALVGTGLGLACSPLVGRLLAVFLTHGRQGEMLDTSLDLRVCLLAAGIAGLATVLIGLVPALQVTSSSLERHIREGAQTVTSSHRGRRLLPRTLMALEVALALILVAGAGLLSSSLVKLYRTGLGFEPKGLISIALSMNKQPIEGPALTRWYRDYADALKHLPGVEQVSYVSFLPLSGNIWTESLNRSLNEHSQDVYMNRVAPEYFATMRTSLIAGRDFRWDDSAESARKIIVSRKAAELFYPGENALGRQLFDGDKNSYEIIGIVGDAIYRSMRDAAPAAGYTAVSQDTGKKPSYVAVIRMHGDAAPLAAAIRQLTTRMAPEIPQPVMRTMRDDVDASITSERLMAMLSVFFAGCALLVTGIGLYGTLAYTTARRTSEIGIRMALGAKRLQVVVLVFRENAWIALFGSLAGLGLALAGMRTLASFLYGVSAHDPWVLLGSVVALGLVSSAASLLPALRAARIEPVQAIRYE